MQTTPMVNENVAQINANHVQVNGHLVKVVANLMEANKGAKENAMFLSNPSGRK